MFLLLNVSPKAEKQVVVLNCRRTRTKPAERLALWCKWSEMINEAEATTCIVKVFSEELWDKYSSKILRLKLALIAVRSSLRIVGKHLDYG